MGGALKFPCEQRQDITVLKKPMNIFLYHFFKSEFEFCVVKEKCSILQSYLVHFIFCFLLICNWILLMFKVYFLFNFSILQSYRGNLMKHVDQVSMLAFRERIESWITLTWREIYSKLMGKMLKLVCIWILSIFSHIFFLSSYFSYVFGFNRIVNFCLLPVKPQQ